MSTVATPCVAFDAQDKESVDPNRVGGPTNHLVEGLQLTIARERVSGRPGARRGGRGETLHGVATLRAGAAVSAVVLWGAGVAAGAEGEGGQICALAVRAQHQLG